MTVAYSNPASVPLLLMLAAEDRTVDQAGNILSTSYYVRSGAPKFLLTLKRGGHFTFSDMDTINPAFGDGIGTSTRDGRTFTFLPNGEAKDIINAYGLAFFDCYLRGSGEAAAFLHTNVRPEEIDLRWEDSRRRRL
jgi:hypothetical protein